MTTPQKQFSALQIADILEACLDDSTRVVALRESLEAQGRAAIEALLHLHEAQAGQASWQPIEAGLPKPGQVVLATLVSPRGLRRTFRAHHAPARTISAAHWEDNEVDEDENGEAWEPAGWYEDPAIGELLEFVGPTHDGVVTRWMPLPAPLVAQASEAQKQNEKVSEPAPASAPAGLGVEPVAWRYRIPGDLQWQYTTRQDHFPKTCEIDPLYTSPTALPGMRMVSLKALHQVRSTVRMMGGLMELRRLKEHEQELILDDVEATENALDAMLAASKPAAPVPADDGYEWVPDPHDIEQGLMRVKKAAPVPAPAEKGEL